MSTDEVYGSLPLDKPKIKFKETTPYSPHSPYSASKAASDHLVKAYHDTYGLNVTISNCSNNYGPNQFPEKLIPLVINNLKNGLPIPVYGKGENVRDWLYVEDHAKAIDQIFHNGKSGETYNIGGKHEMKNIDIIKAIIAFFAIERTKGIKIKDVFHSKKPVPFWIHEYEETIKYVTDRPGHDLRYAIDCSKLENELGWKPEETLKTGIEKTVKWYLDNEEWCEHVLNGEYRQWIDKNYTNR